MQFSDTTNKNGIIQDIEQWAGLTDGTISGNATQLKIVTAWVNGEFDGILPSILSYTDFPRWDDTNHSDKPVGKFDMTSGINNYTVLTDDNSLDILNIVAVRILQSSSSTDYVDLERITLDDPRARDALSPDSGNSGIPTGFVEHGNTIYFDKKPSYTATNGVKVYFEREQSYFASSDTTKEAGIPKPFHRLLPLRTARRWLLIYKPDNTVLLANINAEIVRVERELMDMIELRNPTRRRMVAGQHSNK